MVDTRQSLALELAEERHKADQQSWEECGTTAFPGSVEDQMPDALAFVDRCIALTNS